MEEFVLADDKAEVLESLIPGTEDYYYYHCLYLQHSESFDEVEPMVHAWVERQGWTERVHEILNRQALLTYNENPEATLERLRSRLGVRFDHEREVEGRVTDYPTRLDQKLISRVTLMNRALGSSNGTGGVTDYGLEWIPPKKLGGSRRRSFLSRLTRPDYPLLVRLILDDLDYSSSEGFGFLAIHNLLLREQMDELAAKREPLLTETRFVHAYIAKLRPAAEPALGPLRGRIHAVRVGQERRSSARSSRFGSPQTSRL